MNLCLWIKNNKLTVFLLVIIILLLSRTSITKLPSLGQKEQATLPLVQQRTTGIGGSLTTDSQRIIPPVPVSESPPQPEAEKRMVVQESSISLLVDDVREKVEKIIEHGESQGGYLVSSTVSQPEEAPYATVILRVPSEKLQETVNHFRTLAIRVTSENLKGWDVTDEYVDLQARVETLEKTKNKFEDLLNQATKIDEILQVERELSYLQERIDNLKGRQEYLQKTSETAKLTVHLSSDEWALPYAPEKPFRPKVIFKQAVRSLVLAFRLLARLGIWVGVYAVIWAPVLLIINFLKKRRKKK